MDQHRFCHHYWKLLAALFMSGLSAGVAWGQTPTTPQPAPSPGASPTAASGKPASTLPEAPEAPDKVVLKVGDQQFTKADLDAVIESLGPQAQRAIASQGKKPFGDQYSMVIMLALQAHQQHLDQTPAFVHRLEFQKEQLEAQAAYQEIHDQAKPSPEEINKYYSEHAANYDEIMVRQFVIREKPAETKTDAAHPAATPATGAAAGLTPDEAKVRAEAIRKEVTAGTDIKKVMEDFKSSGDVTIEAEPRKIRHGGMRPDLEKIAFALKDGETSEPVALPQALIFFQVTGHSHLDVKDVTPEIERTLQKDKVDAALAQVKKNTSLWMDEQYFAPPLKLSEAPTLGPQPAKPAAKP